jgi:hypothetical protein
MPQEAEAVRQEATRLAADQSVARMRAAQILRAAGATAPAVAAAQGAPAPVQETQVEQPEPVLEEEMAALEKQFVQEPEVVEKNAVQARTEDYVTTRAALLRRFNQAVRNGQRGAALLAQQQIAALDRANQQPVLRAPAAAPERPIQQNDFSAFAQALRGLPVLRPGAQPVVEEQVDGETMSRGVAAAAAPSRSPTLPAGLTEAEVVIRPDVLQNPNLSEEEYAAEWKRIFDLQTRLVKKDFPSANSEDERKRINSVIESINDQLLSLAKTRGGPPEGWTFVE